MSSYPCQVCFREFDNVKQLNGHRKGACKTTTKGQESITGAFNLLFTSSTSLIKWFFEIPLNVVRCFLSSITTYPCLTATIVGILWLFQLPIKLYVKHMFPIMAQPGFFFGLAWKEYAKSQSFLSLAANNLRLQEYQVLYGQLPIGLIGGESGWQNIHDKQQREEAIKKSSHRLKKVVQSKKQLLNADLSIFGFTKEEANLLVWAMPEPTCMGCTQEITLNTKQYMLPSYKPVTADWSKFEKTVDLKDQWSWYPLNLPVFDKIEQHFYQEPELSSGLIFQVLDYIEFVNIPLAEHLLINHFDEIKNMNLIHIDIEGVTKFVTDEYVQYLKTPRQSPVAAVERMKLKFGKDLSKLRKQNGNDLKVSTEQVKTPAYYDTGFMSAFGWSSANTQENKPLVESFGLFTAALGDLVEVQKKTIVKAEPEPKRSSKTKTTTDTQGNVVVGPEALGAAKGHS